MKKKHTYFIILFCILVLLFLITENLEILQYPYRYSWNKKENILVHFSPEKINELKNIKIREKIELYEDNSLQKYVSEKTKIPQKYVPAGLQPLDNTYAIVNKNIKGEITDLLVFQAKNSFTELSKAFYEHFKKKLRVNSSYRAWQEQYYLLREWCSNARCASIGASEHQLGLAIDLAVAVNTYRKVPLQKQYLERMNNNAYKYWFINTYKKGYKIDGKMKEAWHRRYVGLKLAKILEDKQLSFAEFYRLVENQK